MHRMLLLGDCLDVLPHWPDNSFDLVCTDPPYHLTQGSRNGSPRTNNPNSPFGRHRVGGERAVETKGFMGQAWDGGDIAFRPEVWREVLRVAKPGAYLTAFGGTRTFHRLVCAIEDAGWEVRDCLMWLYGVGMPKGLNISKQLDKLAGTEPQVVGHVQYRPNASAHGEHSVHHTGSKTADGKLRREWDVTAPATELAKLYEGYNVALKPSYEPVVLARKPLAGTVAQNVQQYGTGGLNIDASRVEPGVQVAGGGNNFDAWRSGESRDDRPPAHGVSGEGHAKGRWPPNVLLGHAADCTEEACCQECPVRQLDEQAPNAGGGTTSTKDKSTPATNVYGNFRGRPLHVKYDANGGASRFFPRFHYSSKTSRKERAGSSHPTIKPLAVVEWLLRLTAPPGKPMVLDPFVGSGTTLIAAHRLGIEAVGIEQEPEHVEQAYQRYRSMT